MRDYEPLVGRRVDERRVKKHLDTLCREIGPREPGSPEEQEAAAYVISELRSYGLEPVTEICAYRGWAFHNTRVDIVAPAFREMTCAWLVGSPATPPDGIQSDLVDADDGSVAAAARIDLRGKIALVRRPVGTSPGRFDVIRRVAEQGAIGYLEYSEVIPEGLCQIGNTVGNRWTAQEAYAILPCATITRKDAMYLRGLFRTGQVKARLTVGDYEGVKVWRRSPSVYARIEGREEDEYFVILAAHIDAHTPGAHDNASGVAYTLELARLLANEPQLRPFLMFFPGAEQFGLRGSTAFVREHPDWVKRTLAVVDYGAIGDGDALWVDRTPDLTRSVAASVASAGPPPGCPIIEQPPAIASDHAPFIWLAGVPGVEIHYREFHYLLTSLDTPDNIDVERVLYAGEIGARLALSLANAPIFPLNLEDYADTIDGCLIPMHVGDSGDIAVLRSTVGELREVARRLRENVAERRVRLNGVMKQTLNAGLRSAVEGLNMRIPGDFAICPQLRATYEQVTRLQASRRELESVPLAAARQIAFDLQEAIGQAQARLTDEMDLVRDVVVQSTGILRQTLEDISVV